MGIPGELSDKASLSLRGRQFWLCFVSLCLTIGLSYMMLYCDTDTFPSTFSDLWYQIWSSVGFRSGGGLLSLS